MNLVLFFGHFIKKNDPLRPLLVKGDYTLLSHFLPLGSITLSFAENKELAVADEFSFIELIRNVS